MHLRLFNFLCKLVKDYLLLVLELDISSLGFNILEHDNCKLSIKLINQPVSSTLESNFCVLKSFEFIGVQFPAF